MKWFKKLFSSKKLDVKEVARVLKLNDLEQALVDSIENNPQDWEISYIDGGSRAFNRRLQIATYDKGTGFFTEFGPSVGNDFRQFFTARVVKIRQEREEAARKEVWERSTKQARRAFNLE